MQDGTGEIISERANDSGKPDVNSDGNSAGGNQSRTYEPEILTGSDGPDTERIQYTDPAGTGNGARRTKSGRIDGRTLRGKRTGSGGSSQTAESSGFVSETPVSKISLVDAITTTNVFLAGILTNWLTLSRDQQKILEIDKSENKALADAITEVAKFHALTFDPKKVAYFNLAVAFGSVYGTRAFALWNLSKLEVTVKPQPTPASRPQQTVPQPVQRTNGKTSFSPSELFGDQGGEL